MSIARYLIFGDLHGRILPAFCLAMTWEPEHGMRLDGLLQVGDLGYFPDLARLDKATARHAADDPLELGASLVAGPSRDADAVFRGDDPPPTLWFTAGNHEDLGVMGPILAPFWGQVCGRDGDIGELPGDLAKTLDQLRATARRCAQASQGGRSGRRHGGSSTGSPITGKPGWLRIGAGSATREGGGER